MRLTRIPLLSMFLAALGWAVCAWAEDAPPNTPSISIAIIGDSTVSDYAPGSVLRGWGQLLPELLPKSVRVVNLAKSGASTKTFLKLPQWKKATESKADFLLIQFGHNDSHGAGHPEATTADGDYADNLRRMATDARAAGLTPIFVTPMHRRSWDKEGKLTHELQPYVDAMKHVAAELKAPLIDLQQLSGELFEKLGDESSTDLTGPKDRTHFTEKGARLIAGLVAGKLGDCDPKLSSAIQPPGK